MIGHDQGVSLRYRRTAVEPELANPFTHYKLAAATDFGTKCLSFFILVMFDEAQELMRTTSTRPILSSRLDPTALRHRSKAVSLLVESTIVSD